MAEDSKKEKITFAAELEFAVRAIASNPHLRALIRHFLSITRACPPASCFDLNPVQNAYNQGYQAAGLELASILTSVDAQLVPTLLLEELFDEPEQTQSDE